MGKFGGYILSAIAASTVTGFIAVMRCLWRRQKAMTDGILAIIHDRIHSIYIECKNKGYATVDDIENMERLYKPYADLGGNGTGTELLKRVKQMPDKPERKEHTA